MQLFLRQTLKIRIIDPEDIEQKNVRKIKQKLWEFVLEKTINIKTTKPIRLNWKTVIELCTRIFNVFDDTRIRGIQHLNTEICLLCILP